MFFKYIRSINKCSFPILLEILMKHLLSLQEINPCIRSAGRDLPKNVVGPFRIIYDYEFIYCFKGDFVVYYSDHSVHASHGQMIIIEPGVLHKLDYSNAIEVYWVHFDFYYLDNQADLERYISINKKLALSPRGFSKELTRPSIVIKPNYVLPNLYSVSDPISTRNAFIWLIDLFTTKSFGWFLEGKMILNEIVLDTINNLVVHPHKNNQKLELIKSIQDYIRANIYRKITSQELNNHFHYHRDTLGRFFKQEIGKTIKTYIKQLRHEKVIQLLLESSISLDVIAEQCGYTDRSHLISDFKSIKNMTPTQYRKQYN